MISIQNLLNFVKENAHDVSDLAAVDSIEKSQSGDPYRNLQIRDLRAKYEAEALEADLSEIFSD